MIETATLQPAQMPWEPAAPTTEPDLAPALSPSPAPSARSEKRVFNISRRGFLEVGVNEHALLNALPLDPEDVLRTGILNPQQTAAQRGAASPISTASLLLQCGHIDEAKSMLATLARDDYWTEYMLAMCHWRAGELSIAEELLRTVAAKNPGDSRPLHALGKVLADQERFKEAVVVLRDAHHDEDDAPALLNDLAAVLITTGEFREALRTLRAALRIEPTYALALANSGVAHQKLDHSNKAIDFFHRALAVDDRCLPAVHNLAEILLTQSKWSDAVELLQPYVERVPEDARAHDLLAWAHISLNRWRDAQRVLEYALSLRNVADASLLNNLATVYSSVRDPRAQAAFQKAIALEPNNSQIRANYAHFLANQGDWRIVRGILRVQDVDGVSNRAALLASSMLVTLDYEEAVTFLRDAIEHFDELRFYQMLGHTLASCLGRPEEAADVYKRALQRFDDDMLRNNLGYALILAGRLEEARLTLEPIFQRRHGSSDITSICVIASYGLLQIRLGEFEGGISLYRDAYHRGGPMKRRILQKIQVEEGRHLLDRGNITKAQRILRAAKDGPDPEFRAQALSLQSIALN
jgi:Flp pilus assembly protein TadD